MYIAVTYVSWRYHWIANPLRMPLPVLIHISASALVAPAFASTYSATARDIKLPMAGIEPASLKVLNSQRVSMRANTTPALY